MDLRDDVLKDRSIRLEQPEPPDGVVAVGCAPTLLVDSGSDHHHGRASQVRIVALAHRNRRRQDRAVLNIRHHTPGPLAVPVDHHDIARHPPHNKRQKAHRNDRARSNNPDLHIFPSTSSPSNSGQYVYDDASNSNVYRASPASTRSSVVSERRACGSRPKRYRSRVSTNPQPAAPEPQRKIAE